MQSFMAGSRLGYGLLAKLANGQRANLDLSKRGADLSRGPQALSKLPAAAWSNTWPAPAATLDLDFANNRGFVRGSGQGGAMDAVTFTRASSGNWVDNTGVLRTGAGTFTGTANALGVNLLTAPQNFENAAWTKFLCAMTANVTAAPDGAITGSLFTPSSADAGCFVTGFASNTYSISIYAKAGTSSTINLALSSSGAGRQAIFTLTGSGSAGAVTNSANGAGTVSGGTSSITDVGNGWYRCRVENLTTTGSNGFVFGTLSATNTVFVWGAQLEVGSSATTYYPTNINAPRFDWASTAQLPYNRLTYTQAFDNSIWAKTATTVTADTTTAPDGTLTADSLFETATTNSHFIRYNATPYTIGGINTATIYIQANGRNRVQVFTESSGSSNYGGALFDLNALTYSTTFSTSGNNFVSASIVDAGGGWRLITITTNTVANYVNGILICLLDGAVSGGSVAPSYAGDATKGVILWGAQLQSGATPTFYEAVTGPYVGVSTPLVANSTCNGLLIEESRTNRILWCRDGLNNGTAVGINLVPYSEQFDNAAWDNTLNVAITANQTTAPDSTNTADLIASNATNGSHYMFKSAASSTVTVTSGVTYNASFYLKKGSGATAPDIVQMAFTASQFPTGYANFNINTGTVGTVSNVTASITNVGSGWYRCSITATATGTSSISSVFGLAFTNNNDGLGRLPSYADATTSDVFIWGAQLLPLALLTDYQITTASAVTNVWSKSNVTVAKTATGIDGVANAATTITASANNAVLIQPISLASGSRTGSVYLKRITGTGNVQVTLDGSTWSTVDLSNGLWNRIVLSGTVTNPCVGIRLTTNGDAVAMDYAQVEDGAFVTSPILTTTATATRALDVGTLYFVNSGPTAGGYNTLTFSSVFTPLSTSASTGVSIRDSVGNTNFNNMILNQVGNGNYQMNVVFGSGASGAIVVTSPNGTISSAASYKNGFIIGAATGASGLRTGIAYGTGSWQPLINTLALTGGGVGGSANMRLKRVIVQPIFSSLDALTNLVSTNA